MPQKLQFPSGGIYEIPDDATQADVDAVAAYDRSRNPATPSNNQAPAPVPASVTKFQNAVVPGHPLDSMMNGLKAMGLWTGENKGKILDMGLEALGPGAGQRIAGPIGGFIGGGVGDALTQAHQMSNNPNQSFAPGRMMGAAIAGALPMKTMKGASVNSMAMESARQAAGNVIAEVAQTGIDLNRLPTADELSKAASAGALSVTAARLVDAGKLAKAELTRKGEASFKDETLLNAHQAGFLLDPEISNPTAINKTATAIAGQSQLQNKISKYNQGVTDQLARQEMGLRPDEPMSPITLAEKSYQAAAPYREASRISPDVAYLVKEWETQNKIAKDLWKKYNDPRGGLPQQRADAIAAQVEATAAEDLIFEEARKLGNDSLERDLREARIQIAKIHAVQNAMNPGSGQIDARVIGGMLKSGAKLTGNLETIARLQQAMPQVMGAPTENTMLRSAGRATMFGGLPATAGFIAGGPAGAAAAVSAGAISPFLARKAVTSPFYQKLMAMPNYATDHPDFAANLARFATQSLGR